MASQVTKGLKAWKEDGLEVVMTRQGFVTAAPELLPLGREVEDGAGGSSGLDTDS